MSKPYYEPGRYEAEVTSQGFTKAKTGNTQFVLRFLVKGRIDPASPGNLIPVVGYERSCYRVLTDKTIEYFMSDLESLGVSIASFAELDAENPAHVSLAGKTFDAFCSHENDLEGALRERWSIARTAGVKPIEPIASNEVKSLDRLFGKHLRAMQRQKPAPPPNSVRPETADDDMPF